MSSLLVGFPFILFFFLKYKPLLFFKNKKTKNPRPGTRNRGCESAKNAGAAAPTTARGLKAVLYHNFSIFSSGCKQPNLSTMPEPIGLRHCKGTNKGATCQIFNICMVFSRASAARRRLQKSPARLSTMLQARQGTTPREPHRRPRQGAAKGYGEACAPPSRG